MSAPSARTAVAARTIAAGSLPLLFPMTITGTPGGSLPAKAPARSRQTTAWSISSRPARAMMLTTPFSSPPGSSDGTTWTIRFRDMAGIDTNAVPEGP